MSGSRVRAVKSWLNAEHLHSLLSLNVARLAELYKSREAYSSLRARPPLALRLDGVGFGRALEGFMRPRDPRVHAALVRAAKALVERLGAQVAYVVSDEINVVLLTEPPYSGRVEKLVSISAALASAVASLELGRPLAFDSRVVVLESPEDAATYLLYRARVGLNNYASQVYHAKRGPKAETPHLHMLLREVRQELEEAEEWEALGTCVHWTIVEKEAANPITGEKVKVRRRRVEESPGPWACVRALREVGLRG